jgi:hypothetical protein
MFVNGSKMSNLYRGPSIDATYHVSEIPKTSSTPKPLGQMNRNVLGNIYGRPSIKSAHFESVSKHGQHRQFVLLIGRFLKNLLPVLAMFANGFKMSTLDRGPSIDVT